MTIVSQSVSQLFHGPAPRSPLHRLAVRLRHSRSDTSTVTLNGEIGRDLASVGGQDLKKEFMKLKSLSIDSPAANHATYSGPRGRVEFQKRATLLLPLERIASHKELVIVPERELPGCSRK